MSKDKEPRYVPDEDAAKNIAAQDEIYPDEPSRGDEPETSGIPEVHLGDQYKAPSGVIMVQGETLELPDQVRQTAVKIGVNLKGELQAKPATLSELGGGLKVVKGRPKGLKVFTKSSRQIKFRFPKDD